MKRPKFSLSIIAVSAVLILLAIGVSWLWADVHNGTDHTYRARCVGKAYVPDRSHMETDTSFDGDGHSIHTDRWVFLPEQFNVIIVREDGEAVTVNDRTAFAQLEQGAFCIARSRVGRSGAYYSTVFVERASE